MKISASSFRAVSDRNLLGDPEQRPFRMTLLFVAGLFLLCQTGRAYEINEVLLKIEYAENSIKNIQFAFQQEVDFSVGGVNEKIEGLAAFQKGNKFRIEKLKPQQEQTVSDGKNVWIYHPKFNQLWVADLKNWSDQKSWLNGIMPAQHYADTLRTQYDLKIEDGGAGEHSAIIILAVPKQKELEYQLKLVVSTETWLPVQTDYISESSVIKTRFNDYKINQDLPENAFKFVQPKGVDVIEMN